MPLVSGRLFEDAMSDISEYLDKRLDRLEAKVDQLLAFKWQIIGGSAVLAAIISVLVQIMLK